MSTALFDPIKTMSKISDTVLVSFSGGKESIVVLDLCMKHFRKVHVMFQYMVPGLHYEEDILTWYENRYGIEIIRTPGECVSEAFHYGEFRPTDLSFPLVSQTDVYNYYRVQTDSYFIASGERIDDSLQRRAMIKKTGTIDIQRGRFYPVAMWKKNKLAMMSEEFDLDLKDDMGFTESDVDFMFEGDERFSQLFETQEKEDMRGKLQEVKNARDANRETLKDRNSISWFTVIVFETEADRDAFHKEISIPKHEQYITEDQVRRISKP